MEVKTGFLDPEKMSLFLGKSCSFGRGNRYKDYVNIFPGPNFVNAGVSLIEVSQKRCSTVKYTFNSAFISVKLQRV